MSLNLSHSTLGILAHGPDRITIRRPLKGTVEVALLRIPLITTHWPPSARQPVPAATPAPAAVTEPLAAATPTRAWAEFRFFGGDWRLYRLH